MVVPVLEDVPVDAANPGCAVAAEAAGAAVLTVAAKEESFILSDLPMSGESPVLPSASSGKEENTCSLVPSVPAQMDPYCLDPLDPFQPEMGWNIYTTLRVSKKWPQYVPYPAGWLLNGPSSPMRKSITFVSHMEGMNVMLYLGKTMRQEVRLERGSNVFTWVEPNLFLSLGAHMVPQGGSTDGYLSFGAVGDTYWRILPFGLCDRSRSYFGSVGYLARDFSYPEEDWDSVSPSTKLVAIVSTDQLVELSNYMKSTGPFACDMGPMGVPDLFPLRQEYLTCSYFELLSYRRFVHPVDYSSLTILPTVERTFSY
jgi:hypothetical protein